MLFYLFICHSTINLLPVSRLVMPKKSSFLRDCTDKCSSVVHAAELIAAVTLPRSSISDKQLASYLKSKCRNFHWVQCLLCFSSFNYLWTNYRPSIFLQVCDEFGRKVLHMAASCGRKELCQWLIKCYKVSIDDQDKESAYTSLHRAVLYGNIDVAVLLIQVIWFPFQNDDVFYLYFICGFIFCSLIFSFNFRMMLVLVWLIEKILLPWTWFWKILIVNSRLSYFNWDPR